MSQIATTGAQFITLGCRLNIAETAAMRQSVDPSSDVVVVNSCAVTNEAVRRTRQAIRRAHRERPDAQLVVTGCAAQIDPDSFAAMPEVDRVVGNREKLVPDTFDTVRGDTVRGNEKRVQVADIMRVTDTAPHLATSFAEHARAFVEVQNGCDHRCTFCIIPYGRGNSRSVPAGEVVAKVRDLVENGYREIVLTGVDVTSYGHDLPGKPDLGLLVERILKLVPGLPRLRLSSLDGIEVDERLFDLITAEARVMPHIHLSLQSGDDMILKRMKRRHSRAQAIDLVARMKAKRPDIAIGADIIAGFPTETEAMHANNVSIIAQCDVVHGHIFPFSPREGTPAARMPQLDRKIIKQRAAELRAAVEARSAAWHRAHIGRDQQVLVEGDGQSGHAPDFARVALDRECEPGRIVSARITDAGANQLTGSIAA